MDALHITFLVVIVLLLVGLVFCVKRISKLVTHVEELGVQVEESLDELHEAHQNIIKTATHDVVSDDQFVRRVVASLFNAADAVHKVAMKLASFDKSESKKK